MLSAWRCWCGPHSATNRRRTDVEPAGWLLLALSWGAIGWLVAFCLSRVLRAGDDADRE